MVSFISDNNSTMGSPSKTYIPARPIHTECMTIASPAPRHGGFTLVQPPKSLKEWAEQRGRPVHYSREESE
ncbi:hypothetical protein FBEOM_8365 [Fusarium beomiforme]|uniref:Uncharacterized protein n=1 Tax=Fusarium beomiforme TaxID=44412 RepID=A0A9P5DXB4_9HYPO|nr:hypothetical protein FBEOM_8365 [Fusarium beomiforme]